MKYKKLIPSQENYFLKYNLAVKAKIKGNPDFFHHLEPYREFVMKYKHDLHHQRNIFIGKNHKRNNILEKNQGCHRS